MSEAPSGTDIRYRVLVADDTIANRTLVRAYLGRLGFDTLVAENGREAVAIFERERPDIVLMDVMMPEMDGLEATQLIRKSPAGRSVPIVMLSALGSETDIVNGLDTGADDYLIKPLSYQIFAAKLRTVARSLSLQRQTETALAEVRAISEAMIDGLVAFDAEGAILAVNPALCAMLARRASSLKGESVFALFQAPGSEQLREDVAARLGGHRPLGVAPVRELLAVGPGECSLPLELALSELPDGTGSRFLGVVRDISERKRAEEVLAQNTLELQRYHDEAERENTLAQEILERQFQRGSLDDPCLSYLVLPAQRFSGDMVLAARTPDGRLFVLLADATGHGLAAAVSVLPAVPEFYRRVGEGPTLGALVAGLNNVLVDSLPIGRFLAASVACFDFERGCGEVWVGGMPDALLLDDKGGASQRFASTHLPLGIDSVLPDEVVAESFRWAPGSQLLLFSDGLLESGSPTDAHFGYQGIMAAVAGTASAQRCDAIVEAVRLHCEGLPPHDDISMMLVTHR